MDIANGRKKDRTEAPKAKKGQKFFLPLHKKAKDVFAVMEER